MDSALLLQIAEHVGRTVFVFTDRREDRNYLQWTPHVDIRLNPLQLASPINPQFAQDIAYPKPTLAVFLNLYLSLISVSVHHSLSSGLTGEPVHYP
jgi:hypothetical protein